MSILLTGGAGFIGSHTAVELLAAGYEVVLVDNYYNSNSEIVSRIEEITGKKLKSYNADVTNKTALSNIFAEQNIDCVIHFAGYKAVGESVQKPLAYYRNNLDSTLTLLEVMAEHKCKNFIFSSSATVYGVNCPSPCVETMGKGDCTNPYGWTKWMIEQILQDAAIADPDLSVVLLRYFNPVGAHKSGLIGEKPNGIPNNLFPYISQVASGKLKELSVFGNDYPTHDGTGVRDYIHVIDLAKGHVAAISYCTEHKGTEVFNLGTGVGYSVLDMVKAFEKVNKVPVPYKITTRRSGDIAICYSDATKAKELLGWKAELSLEDMCKDAWRWEQNCK